MVVRVLGAVTNGIGDCDETFNYWEPLHYLLYGYGLQTWEYSPSFAIRSYAFLLPYAWLARLKFLARALLPKTLNLPTKLFAFYSVRIAQALVSALGELALYDAVVFRFGNPVAPMFLCVLLTAPGLFRASSEFLPSSFAMILMSFSLSRWFLGDFRSAVFLVAVAAGLGWPFAALLGVPLAMHVVYRRGLRWFSEVALASGIAVASYMVLVDSRFFGKVVLAPLNIILYNVFPVEGAGPGIFGEEPWFFYIVNLALNFNVTLPLVLAYPAVWTMRGLMNSSDTANDFGKSQMERLIFLSPCLLWVAFFSALRHKEERFMTPSYTLLALTGAVCCCDIADLLESMVGGTARSSRPAVNEYRRPRFRAWFRYAWLLTFLATTTLSGLSRTYMQLQGFGSPFRVMTSLAQYEFRDGLGSRDQTSSTRSAPEIGVCFGNEWYRYPSSFFFPERRYRLKFAREDFRGLLPKYFDESWNGTMVEPRGMNMFNEEDPNQYARDPAAECHYVVLVRRDTSTREDENQQLRAFGLAPEQTLTLFSEEILDSERSPAGYRAFWIPGVTNEKVTYARFEVVRNLILVSPGGDATDQ